MELLAHLFATSAMAAVSVSVAQDTPASHEALRHFESEIRPVLVDSCYECHSANAGKSKGGLLVDSAAALLTGGDNGPAIVPGDAQSSLLITAISYHDADFEMPPKERLSEEVVAEFRKWIDAGAADPRGGQEAAVTSTIDIEEGQKHWAYQPVQNPDIPTSSAPDWAHQPLDHFVLARLDQEELSQNPDADATVLLRRLHFDLNGLPPTPEEIKAFGTSHVHNPHSAIRDVVDDLLSRDAFGERWARHWLDVARYAESNGKESNNAYPHAWRYRDYVVDSFNDDKPYDRFLTEQIAGDLLDYEELEEQANNLIATGFLALGAKSLNESNRVQFDLDTIDEQLATLGHAVLGTSIQCARCHDHKAAPIPTEDYYAMVGIFASTDTYFGTHIGVGNSWGGDLLYLPKLEDEVIPGADLDPADLASLRQELTDYNAEQMEIRRSVLDIRNGGPGNQQELQIRGLRLRGLIGRAEEKLAKYGDEGEAYAQCMGVWEGEQMTDARLLVRGDIDRPAQEVPRGFLQIFQTAEQKAIPVDQSGRLELAQWITAKDNPLTARVMVNRVWHHLFGRGLVSSPDDFGPSGEVPSHPELLDHLASGFIRSGWSVKTLIKEIVTSRTYAMSSDFDEQAFNTDPENAFFWRHSKRRLDAEAIRDAMLAVSGNLDPSRPNASPVAYAGDGPIGRRGFGGFDQHESNHRSLYLPVVRGEVPAALAVFDFPDPALAKGARDTTNVPGQALYLLNSDFIAEQAKALAQRVVDERKDAGERLEFAFALCYGREPSPAEAEETKAFFARFAETARTDGVSEDTVLLLTLQAYCQALLASSEFRNLD